MKKRVAGLGELLWDIMIPADAEYENMAWEAISPENKKAGGAPANVVYYASQFGNEAITVSAIGNDREGEALRRRLEGEGISFAGVQYDSRQTGKVYILKERSGDYRYRIVEDTAWDHICFTERLGALAAGTDCAVFGTLAQRNEVSAETIRAFLHSMPETEGVYKLFDINLRQHYYTKEIIETSLRICNVLKINHEELQVLSGVLPMETRLSAFSRKEGFGEKEMETYGKACAELAERFRIDIIILTCAEKGNFTFSPEGFLYRPAAPVRNKEKGADAVGAGDAFTAAFISAVMAGRSVWEAQCLASGIAAYVCSRQGAMHRLPRELLVL